MSEHGRIIAVTERSLGSSLTADTAAGATSLTVVDAAEFDDQNGGWLSINGQVIQYASLDDDTGVITLVTGSTLAAAADEGDGVLVYDPTYQTVAVDKRADVVLDGADDNTDAIDAGIAMHLVDKLDTGIRGDTGESVLVEEEAGDWRIIDVLGLGDPNMTGSQPYEDIFTLTSDGAQTLTLTHEPQTLSEDVKLNGLGQTRGVDWTRDGTALTITAAMDALTSDELKCQYTYLVAVSESGLVLPFQSPSWRYLQVSRSDTNDYSATGFDDSAWATGAAAFGGGGASAAGPAASTNWATGTALWVRRTVDTQPDIDLTVSLRVDDYAELYWNGTRIGSVGSKSGFYGTGTLTIPAAQVLDSNTVAVRAADKDGTVSSSDVTYFDMEITR